jgi:hypothetical protein
VTAASRFTIDTTHSRIRVRRQGSVSYDSLQTDFQCKKGNAHPPDAPLKSGKEIASSAIRNESID